MNINRDYLIINDVKKSNVKLDNGSIFFYITDKNTQNIFVNLVINISNNDLIQKYANIENAKDYTLTMNIVKPDNTYKIVEGKLHDKEKAIFEFNLNEDCCDEIGTYRCELLTKCTINDREEITTSNKLTYKVKASVLNDLDDIVEAPEYPLVIQLFDKLSDIEQYEEDRRANELARQLAEEQRQARFDTLDADMTDRVTAMDDKMADVENRISAKEEAVDALIVNTKADIDNYKATKDQEIDEYKTAKDTEINNAITTQDNKINEFINERNDRLNAIEAKNTEQDNRLDITENRLANIGNDITNTMQPIIDGHTARLDAIEAIDVAQNNRLDAIESKNTEQDNRLLGIEKVNKQQAVDIKCLYGASQTIDVTEEGNSIHLQNSNNGFAIIDEIKGSTLVNCNKEPDKELILNGNINTSGDNAVTITEGVDGGLVDVALEGNTLVNVSKTKDSTAITKSYTVENSGNHIALQGDVDGSCRPVITGNTLVNLWSRKKTDFFIQNGSFENGVVNCTSGWCCSRNVEWFKPNTEYTVITYVISINGTDSYLKVNDGSYNGVFTSDTAVNVINKVGIFVDKLTTHPTITSDVVFGVRSAFIGEGSITYNMIILEGDYTDKEIPDYFEGLQSSFEDNLVTQEMIDAGGEVADNLGKYRAEYKVTGKNLFDKDKAVYGYPVGDSIINNGAYKGFITSDYIYVKNIDIIYIGNITSSRNLSTIRVHNFDKNKKLVSSTIISSTDIPTYRQIPSNTSYIRISLDFRENGGAETDITGITYTCQIEEGDTATSYEPYKEYTKTLYLNSPLLEGDTIEEKDSGIYHVHRSELVTYTEGDETSLITDKVNTLHQLSEPTYELIEQSNLAIPSYANGHLDFDTAVPVEKVEFKPFSEELTYLYPNTKYTVQFISTRAILVDYYLGGTLLLSQPIIKGLNRISITTPSELVDNKLTINGNDTGANIMEVIVTDTDRELIYFEGMKSVGECEDLQVISINSERRLVNTQQLTHEPLRGTRDAKDRYVLIDGKWYIERKCGIRAYQEGDKDNYKTDLINTVYPLEAPAYEEINYNPLEVYSGTTNITTNSVIPCNITVKNHGFNCLLKPSTTYTISSNLGLNTVTTPSTLTEDCLRFMDTDTSDVTTMKNVLVLEGDWTTKADLIPTNFSGIESAFEQEYDAEKGKYKVNVKVIGKNLLNINNVVKNGYFTTASVSDNILTVTGKWYIKIPVNVKPYTNYRLSWKHLEGLNTVHIYDLDGKTKLGNTTFNSGNRSSVDVYFYCSTGTDRTSKYTNIQLEEGDTATSYEPYKENNITFYLNEPLRGVGNVKDRVYVKDDKVVVQRNCGIRAYEDGDFGTYPTDKVNTVYPLTEPVYEEVEYNDVKLFIESFKNSTLFYNSNIPVTSTVHYSYSVPIIDTVAQTANVTDQQDSMIIDLATQVAVMEMMLM